MRFGRPPRPGGSASSGRVKFTDSAPALGRF
jgi:hypothetical protein